MINSIFFFFSTEVFSYLSPKELDSMENQKSDRTSHQITESVLSFPTSCKFSSVFNHISTSLFYYNSFRKHPCWTKLIKLVHCSALLRYIDSVLITCHKLRVIIDVHTF